MRSLYRTIASATLILAAGCQPTFQQRFGWADDDHARFVRETSLGAFVLGGESPTDARVLETDAFGANHWSIGFAPPGSAAFTAALALDDGATLVAGVFPENDGELWLVTLGPDGYVGDNRRLPGAGLERAEAIARTLDGGFILAGQVVVGSSGSALLVRLDAQRRELWRRTYGTGDGAIARDVLATADEGFVFSGSRGTPSDAVTAWLVKVDGTGAVVWERTYAEASEARGLAPLASGGFALGLTATPGPAGTLLIRTDPLGHEIWRQDVGDPAFELGHLAANASQGFGFGGRLDLALHVAITDEAGNVLGEESLDRGSLVHSNVGLIATRDGGYALVSTCATVGETEGDLCLAKTDAEGRSAPAPL